MPLGTWQGYGNQTPLQGKPMAMGAWQGYGNQKPAVNKYPNVYTQNSPYNTVYQGFGNQQGYPKMGAQAPKYQGGSGGPSPGGPAGANQNQFPDLANLDYSSDPVLQNLIASQNAARSSGQARQLEGQKQLLLQFGSKEMARKLLGEDPFVNTISDDPYTSMSTLALNKRAEIDATRNANENTYNPANLFFSSARGQGLADIVRQRVLADAAGERDLQTGLQGYADQYNTLLAQLGADRSSAEGAAYERAIKAALASFYSGQSQGGALPSSPSYVQGGQLGPSPGSLEDMLMGGGY